MDNKEMLIEGAIFASWALLGIIIIVVLPPLPLHQNHEPICIEREFYCPPYSDMHHPCFKQKCTVSDDAGIDNNVYSLYANRTQLGMNYNVSTIPDDAYITSVCVNWYDDYGYRDTTCTNGTFINPELVSKIGQLYREKVNRNG